MSSEGALGSGTTPAGAGVPLWNRVRGVVLSFSLLLALCLAGLYLTDAHTRQSDRYWMVMFPIFGLVSTYQSWRFGRLTRDGMVSGLVRELLHWGGPILFLQLIYYQHTTSQIDPDEIGVIVLIVLSLTCFLAGVHFAPPFYLASGVLAVGVVLLTAIERYFFAIAAGLVVVALLVLGAMLARHRFTAKE